MKEILNAWMGWIVSGTVILGLAAMLGQCAPGCDERTHRHVIERMHACIETCGDRGVALNQPSNSPPCVCR